MAWEPEIDNRAFMRWFWRDCLKQYKVFHPDAKKLPENYGATKHQIDAARQAYMAGFKRRDNLWRHTPP